MTEFYDKYLKYKNKYLNLKVELAQEGAGKSGDHTLILFNNTTPFGLAMNANKKKDTDAGLTSIDLKHRILVETTYGNTSIFKYTIGSKELIPLFSMGDILKESNVKNSPIDADTEKQLIKDFLFCDFGKKKSLIEKRKKSEKDKFNTSDIPKASKIETGEDNREPSILIRELKPKITFSKCKSVLERVNKNIELVNFLGYRKDNLDRLANFYTNLGINDEINIINLPPNDMVLIDKLDNPIIPPKPKIKSKSRTTDTDTDTDTNTDKYKAYYEFKIIETLIDPDPRQELEPVPVAEQEQYPVPEGGQELGAE